MELSKNVYDKNYFSIKDQTDVIIGRDYPWTSIPELPLCETLTIKCDNIYLIDSQLKCQEIRVPKEISEKSNVQIAINELLSKSETLDTININYLLQESESESQSERCGYPNHFTILYDPETVFTLSNEDYFIAFAGTEIDCYRTLAKLKQAPEKFSIESLQKYFEKKYEYDQDIYTPALELKYYLYTTANVEFNLLTHLDMSFVSFMDTALKRESNRRLKQFLYLIEDLNAQKLPLPFSNSWIAENAIQMNLIQNKTLPGQIKQTVNRNTSRHI